MATCPSIRAHWRHLENTIELVHPSALSSPQPIRQMDQFSCFCTAYGRKCLSTRIAPSHGGSGPPIQHMMLLAHTSPQPKRHPDWFSRLCTDDCGVSLYFTMVCLFSLKIAPSHIGIWTSFNMWFIGPTRVRDANGNLIVSAVFAGLTY